MLIYRFPGGDIVKKSGHFIPCNENELDGFIVSTFSNQKFWKFKEEDVVENLQAKHEKPSEINRESYLIKAQQLIKAIQSLGLRKVVFSRIKSEDFNVQLSNELFILMEEKYPKALVYLFSDSTLGTWIGASPEILLEQYLNSGITTSLAGTKSIDDSSAWSEKEVLEQEYVTIHIQEILNEHEVQKIEMYGPYDYSAGPVKHLKTDFIFECSAYKALKLIQSLHPTPAVCGLPKDFALEIISQIETHNRELYTGIIGEFNENHSKLYVNLRCAKIMNNKIYYFLGGGFTKDSSPELEWLETENKKKTISDLIDLL